MPNEQREAEEAVANECGLKLSQWDKEHIRREISGGQPIGNSMLHDLEKLFVAAVRREVEIKRLQSLLAEREIVFICNTGKCRDGREHQFTETADIVEDGKLVGGSLQCAVCGILEMEVDMWRLP